MRTFDAFIKYFKELYSFMKISNVTFEVMPGLDMKDFCTNIVFQHQADGLLETDFYKLFWQKPVFHHLYDLLR